MKINHKKILILIMILSLFQILALDTKALDVNLPNVQDVSAMEQSGPKSFEDISLEYPIDQNNYRLGPGDQLAVHIIVGDAELAIDYMLPIGADGQAFLPNIGEIYLSGSKLAQAKQMINSRIKNIYKERYQLSVLLNQPKKVKIYLSGMVKNPGPLAVYDNSRISEVISQGGGVASGASNRYIYIKRKNASGGIDVLTADLFEAYRSRDLSKDLRIQAGDVIEVPDSKNERVSLNQANGINDKLLFEGKETFVYVYGEVSKSGRFEYVPGKKISDYISYAGGPTTKALLNYTSLTRQENGRPKQYSIDVSDVIYNGNQKKDIEVMGGDVIRVPGNFFYFNDFASFVNTILLGLTLYNTVIK